MTGERTGLVNSQAKPGEVYPKKSCQVVRQKRETASPLSRCLGIGPTVARFPMDFQGSWFFGSRQYICQCIWAKCLPLVGWDVVVRRYQLRHPPQRLTKA
ncbi:hypothetical protein TNCV_1927191 [Trichonephila clavipes]|nr:hypothetical protein TNCV_1927191 [Trichonephila clavipes]